ncbi:MAG TPA: hypothetical protein PK228_03170 [Saprospiraceae bacterium]|nr:hypothetical protein [Saprospiraceae bacterium]
MRKLIACLLAALPVAGVLAQCPVIYNCPQGSPVVCDISGNDSLLWNDAPYTWSQVLDTKDLYEGTADFNIKILPCADGGPVSISYTLLLDLDNDNLRETAVSSLNLPPAGIVYANNAFNPDYTGGEPVKFDKRPVPDSVKFRFALEVSNSWDTLVARLCWQTGSQYVSPRLPEGRHHLIWRIEQDGVVKYCEHSFRIKDCENPTLLCEQDWTISMDPYSVAVLHMNDILSSAEDNTTPFSFIKFSLRKAGTGTGFPLDSTDNEVITLSFDCEELDSQKVELWAKDRLGNTAHCTVFVTVTDDDGVCEQVPLLCARTYWGAGDIVKPVTYKMIWVDTSQKLIKQLLPLQAGGCGMMTDLPPVNSFSLSAACDTNPLNGVSTFDLLLISKHILGLQPFDAPWKWFAADANKSNSVTTFDVVELRKLILGIYDKLPSNTSWRFFTADCNFPTNPFSAYCPPEYTFITTPLWDYPAEILFNAVKTGDVNGTANPVSFGPVDAETRGESMALHLPEVSMQTGETYHISIKTEEIAEWLGFQFGLQFDPDAIEIEAITSGLKDFDGDSWALPKQDLLNVSWFNPTPQTVFPDEGLIKLRIKALRPANLSEVVELSAGGPTAEAYTAAETILPLQLQFGNNVAPLDETTVFTPQPNPTTSGVKIPLRLAQPETAAVEIMDCSGSVVFQYNTLLEGGNHMLEVPALAFPAAGVYVWRVQVGDIFRMGKVVRL